MGARILKFTISNPEKPQPAPARKQVSVNCSGFSLDSMRSAARVNLSFSSPLAEGMIKCIGSSAQGGMLFKKIQLPQVAMEALTGNNGSSTEIRIIDEKNNRHSLVLVVEEIVIQKKTANGGADSE
ncbi:Uncharacterised protein [uncultured archaeon]|nr:Uncharacterised protein [uncultured archaeon]